jgi:hypothetical protein
VAVREKEREREREGEKEEQKSELFLNQRLLDTFFPKGKKVQRPLSRDPFSYQLLSLNALDFKQKHFFLTTQLSNWCKVLDWTSELFNF